MKAEINAKGQLEIRPENTTEAFALAHWRMANVSPASYEKNCGSEIVNGSAISILKFDVPSGTIE